LIGCYFSRIQLESVEPANVPLWMGLNVGLVAYKDSRPGT
jgi:hypothetical protein